MAGVTFESIDMSTPEALTELRINGVFVLSAPVLQVDDVFHTSDDIFDDLTTLITALLQK
jgi:hypothetical protein